MPNITTEELDRLRALLGDIDATTAVIRGKCTDAKKQCENLKKHIDLIFGVLNDVQGRK